MSTYISLEFDESSPIRLSFANDASSLFSLISSFKIGSSSFKLFSFKIFEYSLSISMPLSLKSPAFTADNDSRDIIMKIVKMTLKFFNLTSPK